MVNITGNSGGIKSDVLAISILFIFAISIFPGFILTYKYNQNIKQDRINLCLALARNSAEILSRDETWKQSNWNILAHNISHSDFKLMLVGDTRGRLVYKAPNASISQISLLRSTLLEGQEQHSLEHESFWKGTFTVSVPLSNNGILSGALLFSGQIDGAFKAERKVFFWLSLFILANAFLVIIFIIVFLNRSLLQPLKELAKDFESLGQDSFIPRSRPKFNREVQELFEAFDQAAIELTEGRNRLKQQLQTIARTQKQLHQSEKMATVGRLASGVAHELGNPIGALMGFIHLLLDDKIDEKSKAKILEQSSCELSRMDKSIKELLQFSRPSRPEAEPTDITAVAQSAISLCMPQKWSNGISITLKADNIFIVMGERNLLLQVFLNLLANACQAFPEEQANKEINILIKKVNNGEICASVVDNGPGVLTEDVPHLFEPYFTKKEPGSGTGLGLAISMSIINDFGGHMEYKKAESGGAVFSVFLPAPTEKETG